MTCADMIIGIQRASERALISESKYVYEWAESRRQY